MSAPDLKAAPRVKDKSVYEEFHATKHRCLSCKASHPQAAHLLRGNKREDVLAGLIPLCESCHGAFDNGHTYIVNGRRVTPLRAKAAVAAFLRSEEAADQCAYLIERLGPFGAEAYVQGLES